MEMNAEEYKGAEDFGGGDRPEPGRYHVVVKSANEFSPKHSGKVVIDFEVLDGTIPNQVGRKHTEYFATSAKAMPRLVKMAIAVGLLSYGERKNITWSDAAGRQLVIDLEQHDYEKDGETRKGVRITWAGMHALDDDAANNVPKNQAAVELARKLGSSAKPNGNGNGNAATAQPAKAAASSWDDL